MMTIYKEKKPRSSFILVYIFILFLITSFFIPNCNNTSTEQIILLDKYIAGYTKDGSDVDVPCYWKSGSRTDLDVTDPTKNGVAESIYLSGADIYVAGSTKNSSRMRI